MIINYGPFVYTVCTWDWPKKGDTFNITGIFNLTHVHQPLSMLKKSPLESQLACECWHISVIASLHLKSYFLGGVKQRPEIRLCSRLKANQNWTFILFPFIF